MKKSVAFLTGFILVVGASEGFAGSPTCEDLAKSPNTKSSICAIAERGMAAEVERRIIEKPELLQTDCTHEFTEIGHNAVRKDDLITRVINVRFSTDWNDIVVYNKERHTKSPCDPSVSAIPALDATIFVLSHYVDPNEKLTLHKAPTGPLSDASELCSAWTLASSLGIGAGFKDDAKVLGEALAIMNKNGASTYPSYYPACGQL